MTRRGKKEDRQKEHGLRRLRERLGLNSADYVEIVKMIQEGNAKFVDRQSNRITIFDVEYKGMKARIVYDKIRKNIVTAVPPGSDSGYRRNLYGD